MRRHLPVTVFALALAISACSGGKEPSASDSPPPTRAEIAYYDCLKDQGVKISHTDSGAPRVDKDRPVENLAQARKACESKLPPRPGASQAPPEQVAAARAESACLRAEGVAWYPDPDPVTAQVDDRSLTTEQSVELKTRHAAAVKKCRLHQVSDGDSVLGG
ncbi:hypothetical protein ACIOD1_04460 [Streptomyces sp. NPDC088097]|uniref:hypothetical protein n=1 Tax=Streptomyces sp. NPDC088097 TaxID=3365823 RepID=UPI0038032158